jgi:predicted nucleic acid-binding protein
VHTIYLDYNCFQRPFDNPLDTRIQIEGLACLEVIRRADEGEIVLVWSFMHDDESRLCPILERRAELLRLSGICRKRQGPTEPIREQATHFARDQHLSANDALHLAADIEAGAETMLTCDDRFLHRAKRIGLGIALMNPVDYIQTVNP